MRIEIASRRPDIEALCRRMDVRRLELFGSAARDDFDPASSDVDLLVEFDPGSRLPALELYFGLKEGLEAVFSRPVDLVMPSSLRNPYVRAEVERERQVLYAA